MQLGVSLGRDNGPLSGLPAVVFWTAKATSVQVTVRAAPALLDQPATLPSARC
jgi:hypothetical protein